MTLRDLQLAGVVNLELCHIKGRIAMQELTIDAKPFSIQANNLAWIIREADSKRRRRWSGSRFGCVLARTQGRFWRSVRGCGLRVLGLRLKGSSGASAPVFS
ncbi:hypothetical protein ACFQY5_36810 [Paeniroseomonas aquatica]|uniref:hypothetical protein n=1 Tax=Paeniroseomonas aquatica TaxID=373043 RepID=UPI00361FCCB8